MRVIVPGHVYHLEVYDIPERGMAQVPYLVFMRRVGEKYPGNIDTSPGTNCQEVLRVLIDRCQYLNQQWPHLQTEKAIRDLRRALTRFEVRAKQVKGKKFKLNPERRATIEHMPTCKVCGHILCEEKH